MMMTRALTLTLALGAALALGPAAVASPAATLADGKVWKMTGENGRRGQLTLNADGTGTMRGGPFSMQTKWWAPTANGLCLENRMMGRRCVSLVAAPGGFDGVSDGVVVMRLRR